MIESTSSDEAAKRFQLPIIMTVFLNVLSLTLNAELKQVFFVKISPNQLC